LPDYVFDAHSVDLFRNRLDGHWCTQELFYYYESELSDIGNRSFNKIKVLKALYSKLRNDDDAVEEAFARYRRSVDFT